MPKSCFVEPSRLRFGPLPWGNRPSDGATGFEHACKLGLEGIVSKRRDAPYRSGRSGTWLKGEEPRAPGDVSRLGRSVLMTREASCAGNGDRLTEH
jgi:hypothetical protein